MKRKILAWILTMAILFVYTPISAFAENTGETDRPLAGKYISVIGDSISTYTGWSDKYPITDEGYTYRYGEAYYGPVGGDFHNTELLVTDTWWHQAATQLGAEILVSNAGNSTGLLHATYSANIDWEQYLNDMLTYKTRPYHLGAEGKNPDIIAIYIGSNDVAKVDKSKFGTLEDIDFNVLISENSDGTYTYATPVTVAEAYCIMMHKIMVTYPEAEIYCFGVVPNSGGNSTILNKRLALTYPFNEMVKSVAAYYNATYVDLLSEFKLDPNGDGTAEQADIDVFKSYYYGDPHPNASGFDVITNAFVKAVSENSRYIAEVETKAGVVETIGVDVTEAGGKTVSSADGYITEEKMIVDYRSTYEASSAFEKDFTEKYTSTNETGDYEASGGRTESVKCSDKEWIIDIPVTDTDDPGTDEDDTRNIIYGEKTGVISQDGSDKETPEDGIYDYTEQRVEQQGSVTVETSKISLQETIVQNNGVNYIKSTTRPTEDNGLITGYGSLALPQSSEDVPPIAEGYEYVYLGSDQLSEFWAAYASTVPDMENFPNEEPIYNENGYTFYVLANHDVFVKRGLLVPKMYLKDGTVVGEEYFPARYESIQQFYLSDSQGNIATAYCADQKTSAVEGHSYRIVNLKDSTYYSENEAYMIKAIAEKGYWGNDSGKGSLAELKKNMAESGIFTQEEIDALNDGMAITATQYAIWTYSNLMDNKTFYYAYNAYGKGENSTGFNNNVDDDSVALIFKLYHYLASQPVQPIEYTTKNTIINEKNFLKNITLHVKGQDKTHPENLDNIDTNDIYNVDLNFELLVKPDTAVDDLVLVIMEGDNVIAKGRIAGTLQEDEVQLIKDESGRKFKFPGLTFSEGQQNIRFILTGQQYLENAPYLFTSEIKDNEPSQTMVAMAEGNRIVNVSMNISFSFGVDNEIIATEHIWRTEEFHKGSVEGVKTDDSGNAVEGAQFGIFAQGTEVFTEDTALATTLTDSEGKFVFSNLNFGSYIVKELSCNPCYVMNDEALNVKISKDSIKDDGSYKEEISIVNKLVRGGVKLTKVSIERHSKKLSGAEFEIYTDVNQNGIFDENSDIFYGKLSEEKKGVYSLDGIEYGQYLLVETKAPEGFVKDENYYSFIITQDGLFVIVENEAGVGFTNKPIPSEEIIIPVTPQTGDSSNPWIWAVIMAASGAALIISVIVKERKNKEAD